MRRSAALHARTAARSAAARCSASELHLRPPLPDRPPVAADETGRTRRAPDTPPFSLRPLETTGGPLRRGRDALRRSVRERRAHPAPVAGILAGTVAIGGRMLNSSKHEPSRHPEAALPVAQA